MYLAAPPHSSRRRAEFSPSIFRLQVTLRFNKSYFRPLTFCFFHSSTPKAIQIAPTAASMMTPNIISSPPQAPRILFCCFLPVSPADNTIFAEIKEARKVRRIQTSRGTLPQPGAGAMPALLFRPQENGNLCKSFLSNGHQIHQRQRTASESRRRGDQQSPCASCESVQICCCTSQVSAVDVVA